MMNQPWRICGGNSWAPRGLGGAFSVQLSQPVRTVSPPPSPAQLRPPPPSSGAALREQGTKACLLITLCLAKSSQITLCKCLPQSCSTLPPHWGPAELVFSAL